MNSNVELLVSIRKEGHSKVIAVTKLLPVDWRYAQAQIVNSSKKSVTIKFDKVK